MHFKRKVIVFSSSWRFLLNLSSDHLSKGCSNANNSNPTELLDDHDIDIPTDNQVPVSGVQALPQNVPQAPVASSSNNKPSEPPNAPATSVRRYPQRARKKPERLDL